MFSRAKLSGSLKSTGPIFNAADFTPLMAQISATVFSKPLLLEKDEIATEQRNANYTNRPIVSDRHHTAKNFTSYHAKVLSTFASSCSPYRSVPDVSSAIKTFSWYQKLLQNSPMIFFLARKQNLFSESSILCSNEATVSLKKKLTILSKAYNGSSFVDQRARNYHLTDLITSDLFNLALLAEGIKDINVEDMTGTTFWKGFPLDTRLSRTLRNLQKPILIDEEGVSQKNEILKLIPKNYPFRAINSSLESIDSAVEVRDIFPFDVAYNDIFLLTIERLIVQEDHTSLLELLDNQDEFEIVAVRISASISGMGESEILEENNNPDPIARFDATYEELLKWAEKRHGDLSLHPSGIIPVLQKLGHWGFVDVDEAKLGFTLYK